MADTSGLRLVALACEKCGSLLNANPADVVYYCGSCDTGYELINEKDELVQVNIGFALPDKTMDAEPVYYPFWVFDADININTRDASGTVAGFFSKMTGSKDEEKPVKKFYVPAFETSMDNIKRLGQEFTKNQPEFDMIKKDKITGCIYSSKDAEKLADFIFLSLEAEKPDMIKNISYTLGLSSPKVIGIPFYNIGDSDLKDGILGISI